MKHQLDLNDIAVLKGFAIMSIILHNFCHLLPGCAVENEYTFSVERTNRFIELLMQGQHVVLNCFSYAGHYGVAIFLFISGYGLVKKYESRDENIGIGHFMWYNARKLWWLVSLGLVAWFVSDLYLHQWQWAHHWYNVLQLLTFTGNLFPNADLLLGPWWYFSLTMQLYLVYRLFLYKRGWLSLSVVTAVCIAMLAVALFTGNTEMLNYLRYNFVGSMLPFAMGISIARTGVYYNWNYTLLYLAMWVACWFDGWSWLASPLFAALAALILVDVKGQWREGLLWIGRLSSFIFVVHPIVRPYFLNNVKAGGDPYVNLAFYLLLTFIFAVVYRKVIVSLKP